MTNQPYHKYVFDEKKRIFIGRFEDMYADEEQGGYDSWFQEDLSHLGKQISLMILNRYNFNSILDIGCGKGAFTHLLKKTNNRVVGVDISEAAILKAKSKYREVEFLQSTAEEALRLQKKWDLILMMEVLSYLKNWKEVIATAAERTSYLYISLYLPPKPIGFVKSFDGLKVACQKDFNITMELLWNKETIFILGKREPIKNTTSMEDDT